MHFPNFILHNLYKLFKIIFLLFKLTKGILDEMTKLNEISLNHLKLDQFNIIINNKCENLLTDYMIMLNIIKYYKYPISI